MGKSDEYGRMLDPGWQARGYPLEQQTELERTYEWLSTRT